LNDPARTHYPFSEGDRIPDRTYVVFKALARDDSRDERTRPNFKIGFTGYVDGLRQNFTGGVFPFRSDASALDTVPAWDAGTNGWYGDTLGFLTAPNSRFTLNMQSVDEWARRDGSPASFSFDVGYEPCLQCIELLPKPSSSTSGFDANVACVEDTSAAYRATHPCLAGRTELRVSGGGVANPATDLEALIGAVYIFVNRDTGFVTNSLAAATHADSLANWVLPASRYKMAVLLHGKDDPREAWSQAVRRVGGWKYEVSYACDEFNEIKDGGGNDDIRVPTWGQPASGTGLLVNNTTGLWKLEVEVWVPSILVQLGPTSFRIILNIITAGDTAANDMVFRAVTRQFGVGWVEAIALDQTAQGSNPIRPSTFNFFRSVRPDRNLVAGETWRDLGFTSPSRTQLPLSLGAMSSNGGAPVRKYFRLTLHSQTGEDLVCTP